MKATNILETIGNTPIVRINRLFADSGKEVWMKLERANPGGSIKDRIALSMIEDAEQSDALRRGSIIVEPTSGNTGIGLAMVAAVKGYRLILVMPESMSIERRRLMAVYGAEFVLTPREKGMKGAIAKAQEIVDTTPNTWMPQQFDNPANIAVHFEPRPKKFCKTSPKVSITSSPVLARADTSRLAANCSNSISPTSKSLPLNPPCRPLLAVAHPARTPFRALARVLFPPICTPTFWTV